jgi:hypothetical protein
MGTLRAILAEIDGLFVDDGALALALVGWCAAVAACTWLLPALLPAAGAGLFLGCALILAGNVVRAARLR